MNKLQDHILHLRIKDQRGLFQRTLRARDKVRVGLSPDNDIVVFDNSYPKSSPLLEHRGDLCRLYIHPRMSGIITFKDSTLAFQDLMLQDILPREGDFYVLTFAPGRKGTVHIGDSQIAFAFDGAVETGEILPSYTWQTAFQRSLLQDSVFKIALLVLLMLEAFWAVHLKNIVLPPAAPPEIEKVPQRFARFVLRAQPEPSPVVAVGAGSTEERKENRESSQDRQRSGESSSSGSEKAVTSAGLLGLIGGAGSSGKSSAAVDFLLDQGLVKQLDELIGSTTVLQSRTPGTGRGSGSGGGDGLDELIALGQSGGIDDLIESGGVKSVEMQKQGNVNIQAPQAIRGSEQARGQRTAESVMSIIKAQHGRVMYTYNKYLRQNPELSGKVSLDVTIAADGRVADVQIVESTIEDADFIRDLINVLKSLRFPAISEGSVTVNVPFVFNRAG